MMKKLFIIFSILLSLNSFAQPGTYSGNFILDLSLYSSTVSNVDFVRGTQLNTMTSIGNNQYSYNFSSFLPSPIISYNFRVNGVDESFSVLNNCLFINPTTNDTTRLINLNTTTPSVVCWESCSACVVAILGCTDPTANNYNPIANLDNDSCLYNVTFIVDMSEIADPFVEAEVYGDFNNWCGGCAPMTDINNDSIWEITIQLMVGNYEYKFAADAVNIEESLYENDNCVVTAWGFSNRILNVTGNQTLDTVCWNRCYSCDTERNFYNVTFSIDMSNVTSTYTAPEVNGTFNNWCGSCWQLDPQFNNIYSRSFNVDTSLHTFKFSSDNWNIEENLDSSLGCVDLGFDSLGSLQYVNRSLRAISDTVIDVCWESCIACIYGCIDPIACNFNSLAEVDDGSCDLPDGCNNPFYLEYSASVTCPDANDCLTLIVNGCTDPLACNYNNLANLDDGSCDLPSGCGDLLYLEYSASVTCSDANDCLTFIVNGCIDSIACNYNNLANLNDGSCDLPNGCGDALYLEYDASVTCSNTSACLTLIIYGCADILACNFNPLANIDDGSCDLPNGCGDPLYLEYDTSVTCSNSNTCLTIVIYGCTDALACNYNFSANLDDGSCLTLYGCMNTSAINFDSLANCPDTCIFPASDYGCIDSLANNYNPLAIFDDGSCTFCFFGCTNSIACNYDSLATCNDGSCNTIYGCIDSTACNYNLLATCDDGSCNTVYGCMDTSACNYNVLATCDDGSCLTVYGCMDTSACNYDLLATCDDSSCLTVYGCMDTSACNYDLLATCDDGSCNTVYGCTNSIACNYNALATCDDGSCLALYGCTDSIACNYSVLATCDDGSCNTVYGCTDSTACNYNLLATCDDGSCNTVYGCTDSIACNYDVLATCDDGSCLILYGCTDSLAFNYDSLANCYDISSCLYEYNITFQLDLRGQTNISYTTPEINGLFNGWCGNCAELTDLNNDSIWEITVPILEGSGPVSGVPGWEYKFSADNWNIQENLFSGDPCTFSAFGYTNRYINVTQDTILDPVCWQSCNDCYAPQTAYDVTFRLDMSNNSNFSVPEVNGEFNSWCGNCWPMTDDDGDNIWEFNTLIDTAKHEYKFSADNWGIQEQLDSSATCVFTTVDSLGNVFSNRYLHINSDTILDVVCWNECDTCLTTTSLIPNVNDNSYTIFPNPSSGIFYIKSSDKIDKVIVYDILNKKIFEKNDPAVLQPFDISDIKSNILFLEIYINDKVKRDKLIITK
jgi:hypothetical protein